MTKKELEDAGREMLTLETMARISALQQEVDGYQRRYGAFEQVEARARETGKEDFDLDDAYNAWRWAREQLEDLRERLSSLRSDAA